MNRSIDWEQWRKEKIELAKLGDAALEQLVIDRKVQVKEMSGGRRFAMIDALARRAAKAKKQTK